MRLNWQAFWSAHHQCVCGWKANLSGQIFLNQHLICSWCMWTIIMLWQLPACLNMSKYALPLRSVIIESIETMLLNMHKREFETKWKPLNRYVALCYWFRNAIQQFVTTTIRYFAAAWICLGLLIICATIEIASQRLRYELKCRVSEVHWRQNRSPLG